ncbi:MAG: flagellar motor protein MotB [Clostridiales bacterium]|nr:flagellar motor protein MotB [Clostridiales bacterium]MBQ4638599.1 OmpA family protein [Clostridia bacterium]
MRKGRAGLRSATAAQTHDGEQGHWPSFADMMSSIALVLFFMMLLAYIQNLVTGNNLLNTKKQYETTLTQVEEAKDELASLNSEIEAIRLMLAQEQGDLALTQQELEDAKEMLLMSQYTIDQQNAIISSQLLDLNEMKGQMQTIAYLRLSTLEKVKSSITQVMGADANVSLGANGNLILGENLFFDYGSYALKEDGEALLDELGKAFVLFLSDTETSQYVDSIVISGHTDSKGTASANRTLSTNRANAVLNYLMADGKMTGFEDKFSAAGYGSTRPIDTNDTDSGRQNNRRIEVSIILKDDSVLGIVQQFLQESGNVTQNTIQDNSAAVLP